MKLFLQVKLETYCCCVFKLFAFCNKFLLLLSVGNKSDDPTRRQVDTQDAVRFGESMGVRVFETSAKENINVEEVSSGLPVCSTFVLQTVNISLSKCGVHVLPPPADS